MAGCEKDNKDDLIDLLGGKLLIPCPRMPPGK